MAKKPFYIKKKNNQWTPNNPHHTVKTFIDAFENEINNHEVTRTKRKYNLKKEEREALEQLRRKEDIIITNADKGGAVVIQDVADYINEALRQLNDQTFYKECDQDLTPKHNKKIQDIIESLRKSKLLDDKTTEMLTETQPKTPKFYTTPKIHKPDNPGRPVISSINCHTARISQYVDYHLQDHAKSLPSYIKDTTDFINKTKDLHIPAHAILVTMDVSALYTNIPNVEGIASIRKSLTNVESSIKHMTVILTFLRLILTLNNFIFNDKHYLQIKGCAMGTKCAPSYANIFMGEFEEREIYPRITNNIIKYLRFIDDIFFIWKGTESDLKEFFTIINTVHPSIKFTTEYSHSEINFLDTTITIKNNRLDYKIFKKPTDRSSYLHNTSYHPNNLKNNIPYGQALRIKKICSNPEEYNQSLLQMKDAFIRRGYKAENLNKQFDKVKIKNREDLLKYNNTKNKQQIAFITTFNKNLPPIRTLLEKHWDILNINERFQDTFQQTPVIAYRRNKNLKDLLGQTSISNNKVSRKQQKLKGKCQPCLTRTGNLCCKQIMSTSTFTSQQTKRTYQIFHNVNCKSTRIIYLLECNKCHIQYIGKSETQFNQRLNNHRSNAYRPRQETIPACKHFHQTNHDFNRDAKFTIIEQINETDIERMKRIILQRENFWIKELRTLAPHGLNQELNLLQPSA
ncbi:uncharacterized protein [Clytia hemisphaerica]|uniref:uncharacterized protein n=1 Tax=Clytia hemisphaerica TaxID=252671 RepID=UPI0034D39A23